MSPAENESLSEPEQHFIAQSLSLSLYIGSHSPDIRAPDKKGIKDNSKITFLILNKNICCDPSLEPAQ